jgi:hypothetical protein
LQEVTITLGAMSEEMPSNYTINDIGGKSVVIKISGTEKMQVNAKLTEWQTA